MKGLTRRMGQVCVVWDESCNTCGKVMNMVWPRETYASHLLMGGWECNECCRPEERAAIVYNADTRVTTIRDLLDYDCDCGDNDGTS